MTILSQLSKIIMKSSLNNNNISGQILDVILNDDAHFQARKLISSMADSDSDDELMRALQGGDADGSADCAYCQSPGALMACLKCNSAVYCDNVRRTESIMLSVISSHIDGFVSLDLYAPSF